MNWFNRALNFELNQFITDLFLQQQEHFYVTIKIIRKINERDNKIQTVFYISHIRIGLMISTISESFSGSISFVKRKADVTSGRVPGQNFRINRTLNGWEREEGRGLSFDEIRKRVSNFRRITRSRRKFPVNSPPCITPWES